MTKREACSLVLSLVSFVTSSFCFFLLLPGASKPCLAKNYGSTSVTNASHATSFMIFMAQFKSCGRMFQTMAMIKNFTATNSGRESGPNIG